MKAPTQWESDINGKHYAFLVEQVKGKQVVTVNGEPQTVKMGFASMWIGFDEKFTFDGMEAHLVINKNKPDVAVNGIFLQSGKTYIQRPAWSMVFIVLNVLIPIVSLGGLINFLLGIGGAAICVGTSKSAMPNAVKIVLCIVITAAAWAIWFALLLFYASLQA